MCQWATETEVELSQAEFAQYVMDDWGWRQDFVATAANYTQVAA
jgi:hypothetical protein